MMAEGNELQALDKITTEVDEAQIKVILATQCIKAQAFLVEKLKKQVQRNKETCGFISSANLKLQSEITQAEQELKSFRIAKETIKLANVELKREWLVAKEKKLDVIERVQNGEKKYEELWLECKSRYESLPYVKKLLKAAQTAQSLKDHITTLDKQAEYLDKEIQAKKEACLNADRKKVIQLAEFVIHERPNMIDKVNEKSKAITDLMNELKSLDIDSVAETKVARVEIVEKNVASETVSEMEIIDENALVMPKLQLDSLDIDDLISVKLDQVKMDRVDYITGMERKEFFSKPYFDLCTSLSSRKTDIDESISSYFFKPNAMNEEKTNNYSRKKLINILEDVKIDANDAMELVSKVNPDTLHPVELISPEATSKSNEDPSASKNKDKEPIQSEEIEEIEITSSNAEDIVKPPTQFLDGSLKSQVGVDKPMNSQENKKTFSFDSSITPQNYGISGNTNRNDASEENNVNETSNSQLDASAVSDDGFGKIKDMVLKKHNLDLTPPFVYAKNTTLQTKTDEKIVTSKFFRINENVIDETKQQENDSEIQPNHFENKATVQVKDNSYKTIELDAEDDMMVSSPKKQKITDELCQPDKAFSGYLFSHGPQGLPDSLDVSISTTGYEDGDDFPHCIDSSLLLSPKADLPMCSEKPDAPSQEAPNFLSGLRKTGLSFFGCLPAGDTKAGSSAPNQGNSGFSFNFGGEEKKNRGGIFSMFQ